MFFKCFFFNEQTFGEMFEIIENWKILYVEAA